MALDEPWNRWERRPALTTDRGEVHFTYTPGANGDRHNGGQIHAFDTEIPLEDIDHPPGRRHLLGRLTWNGNVIDYIGIDDSWHRKGIGTHMYGIAREINPRLRHAAPTHRTRDAELLIRATAPEEADPNFRP